MMIDRKGLFGRQSIAGRLLTILLLGLESLLSLATFYLLALLGAAACAPRRATARADSAVPLRMIVLIPAHNEEAGIGKTLASLDALDYPRERFEVVVIADS